MHKLLLLTLLLTACTTVPVDRKMPEIPLEFSKPCKHLETVPDAVTLSVFLETVVKNYTSSQDCSLQLKTLIEWYNTQRKLFNSTM